MLVAAASHHGLLVNTDHLSCRTAESLWRAFGDARVERYERNGGAIPYCLKHAFDPCGDWDLGGKGLRILGQGLAGGTHMSPRTSKRGAAMTL